MLATKEGTFLNSRPTSLPGFLVCGQICVVERGGLGSEGFTGSKNHPHKF